MILTFSLSSCKEVPLVNASEDVINNYDYNDQRGLAYGDHIVYVMYGKCWGVQEGMAVSLLSKSLIRFRIKTLLDIYPELVCPKTLAAEAKQEKKYDSKWERNP